MPSKRARKVPEKIQVAPEDLEELTTKAEPLVDVDTENEEGVENTDLSLDQIVEAENEVETTEVNPEDSETTNN